MATKIISVRISEEQHQRILVNCHHLGITVSEWIERRIALANDIESREKRLLTNLQNFKRRIRTADGEWLKEKLEIIIEEIYRQK